MRKQGWPAGLYERGGYFSWRNPESGVEFGLGRNRNLAFTEAVEANLHIFSTTSRVRLVDRLTGVSNRTVEAWADIYKQQLANRRLAANTRRTYASLLLRARLAFGENTALERVTTLDVARALGALREEGKERMAQAFRSFVKDFFRAAVAEGWIANNPVLVTENASVEVKRARLTLDVFKAVHKLAHPWLRNVMDLALVTAQRREDVAEATFSEIRDDAWYVMQRKTGQKLCIPLSLRLDAVGLSLNDVVRRCRRTGVVSKYLIHQTRAFGNSPVGSQIWLDTISRRFSDTLAELKLSFDGKTPPTFHEIRSLSERLYKAQGNVDTQELLGHRDPRTTRMYHDSRGAEWVRVKVG